MADNAETRTGSKTGHSSLSPNLESLQPRPDAGGAMVPLPPAPPMVEAADEPERGPPYLYGFSAEEFDWVPVHRRRRRDGWTVEKQRRFIQTLADTCSVEIAAREVRMSVTSCYRLRRSPEGASFAQAWHAAIQQAALQLEDIAFDRAINGSDEPVFDKEGRRIGPQ